MPGGLDRLKLPRVVLISVLAAILYFAARELLIRRILTLPQLAVVFAALAVLIYLLPKYGGNLLALLQRFLPQVLSLIF